MLADIYQDPLPQKRLKCVLQFGYVPPLKKGSDVKTINIFQKI